MEELEKDWKFIRGTIEGIKILRIDRKKVTELKKKKRRSI